MDRAALEDRLPFCQAGLVGDHDYATDRCSLFGNY